MGQRVHSECAQHRVMDGWATLAQRPHMVGLQYMVGILTSSQHWVNICILIVREVWYNGRPGNVGPMPVHGRIGRGRNFDVEPTYAF